MCCQKVFEKEIGRFAREAFLLYVRLTTAKGSEEWSLENGFEPLRLRETFWVAAAMEEGGEIIVKCTQRNGWVCY